MAQQKDSLEAVQTPDVPISAYHMPIEIRESGRQATVVDGKDLQDLPVQSVDELLRYLPGMEVQQRQGFGVQGDLTMRGSTFTQVLVLLDGMRLNDPLTGHFNSYIPITPSEIARIEIIRGASSARFGADAAGGVINIITHTFERGDLDGVNLEGQLAGGAHNLLMAQQGLAFGNGRTVFSQSLQTNRSNGQPLDSLPSNDFTVNTATAAASHRLSDQVRLMGRASFDYRDFNARYFYTTSPADQSRETVQSWWAHSRMEARLSGHRLQADLAHKSLSDDFVFNPAFPGNFHRVSLTNLLLQDAWENDRATLAFNLGAQLGFRQIRSNDRGNHQDWQQSLFGAASFFAGCGLNLHASLRLDRDDHFGWELSPQMDASWAVGALTLRGSVGRSIRAADYTERYISNGLPGPLTAGRNLGNPALRAENAWSAELGADLRLEAGLSLTSTFFVRQSDGLIDYVLTPADQIQGPTNLDPNAQYLFAQNLAALTHSGLDLAFDYQKRWSKDHQLQLRLGGLWVNIAGEEGAPSKYLANAARFLATLQGNWRWRNWQIGLTGIWKERSASEALAINARLQPQYAVWNVQLRRQLGSGLAVFGRILNVMDTQYQDFLGAQMPGRWLMFGIQGRLRITKPQPDLRIWE